MLNEDELSRPNLNSQTSEDEDELSWPDLNSKTSEDEDELTWPTWTVKPVLSGILLVSQLKYYKSHKMVHSCQSTMRQTC